jgi:acetolactate synthase-1/2/3 large subunit
VIGAQSLVRTLEDLGVELVFGLPGVHNLPIWREMARSSIRLIGVRHEQTAVYAADAFARATGRLGVAVVTTGPGAANTLGATGEAMASRSPVLVIATDIPLSLRRDGVYRGVLHETSDQAAMFAPVTKQATTVTSVEAIERSVREGAAVAREPSSGPVYIGVPTDLLSDPAPSSASSCPAPRRAGGPEIARLDEAADVLNHAQRPLIWAGGGAMRSGAGDEIAEIATRLVAPVVTTYMARGILPQDHPCAVPGPVHDPEVGVLWDEADVVLAIGSDFDGMMTQNWAMPAPPALVSINVDPTDARKNYAPDIVLSGDAKETCAALLPMLHSRDGVGALTRRLADIGASVRAAVQADEPQARLLIDAFEQILPEDAVVVADMCIPGYWLAGYWSAPLPRKLAYPVGWGTLGFSFPASIGTALRGAGPTVCVTGDGGFMFACGELATVVESQAPLTVVLVDDGGYGMLRFDQAHAGDEPFGVDLARPDFTRLIGAFGLPVVEVEGFGVEFRAALSAAVAAREARVVVVNAALRPPLTTSPRWYRRALSAR